jgi:SpoVK/Ycf46/Vps4 family AAA+-type ATPase
LFIDELDALAFSRSKRGSTAGRALVTVLLQELDGVESVNDGILVLGASNTPWDIDDALLRPGRFDRQMFVPPPDHDARRFVLATLLARRPNAGVDLDELARATPLLSGADLEHLVDLAVDLAIEDSMRDGAVVPVGQAHLARACGQVRPSTADWLVSARNHAEFANVAGRYDAVREYLGRKEVRRAL